MAERPQQEMLQKSRLHDSFFGMKGPEPRPSSIATEIVDTDWDEEEILSEIEDEDPNSPRLSLNSVCSFIFIFFIVFGRIRKI
jgi:hypothetical protein